MCDEVLNLTLALVNELFVTCKKAISRFIWKAGFWDLLVQIINVRELSSVTFLFKLSNKKTKTSRETCSKSLLLTLKKFQALFRCFHC